MKELASPLSCSLLLGQEKAKKMLTRTLRRNRLPHCLLFSGPPGVGKTLFARGLAAALNCSMANETSPLAACSECSSCQKVLHGNHPDFQIVALQKGAIKIAQVRSLIKELEFAPYEGATRVVVLEDVHLMGREAANALLKTLEEPYANNLLILTADPAQNLLATIVSRCQAVSFTTLSLTDTADILVAQGVAYEDACFLARITSGSPGQALQLYEKKIIFLWQDILVFLMTQGADQGEQILAVLSFAEQMAELKDELSTLFRLFRHWLRDLLLNDQESLSSYCQYSLIENSKNWSSKQLSAKLRALDRAEEELNRNCQKTLVCEVLLFSFLAKGI